jgi:uncharacterized protein YndB with AHSA1/START domain
MAVQLGNDRTTVYVDGLDVVFERVFDAPRELVWKVMTDPERIPRWWGRHEDTTTVEVMDVRPGGRWRFVIRTAGGETIPFWGDYLEVVPPERIVRTFAVDVPGWGEPGRETMTLEDLGDRTRLVERGHFRTIDELEAQLAVGMVGGALELYDRLADEIARG